LTRLQVPVVLAVVSNERLGSAPLVSYSAAVALLGTSGTEIEPPQRETDAVRFARGRRARAEQQVSDGRSLRFGPVTDKLTRPSVGCTKIVYCLELLREVDCKCSNILTLFSTCFASGYIIN
jgi:hypothetical protein